MLKANEFELKLAATQLQTRSFKFINAKIYALSVLQRSFHIRSNFLYQFFCKERIGTGHGVRRIGEIFVIVDFLEVRMQKFSWVYLQGVERAG